MRRLGDAWLPADPLTSASSCSAGDRCGLPECGLLVMNSLVETSAADGAELSVNAGGAAFIFIMFWPNCWAAVEAEWRRAIALMHSVGRSTCGREERVMSGRCGRGAFTLPGFEHRRASDRLRRAALCEAVEPSIRVDDDRDEAVK